MRSSRFALLVFAAATAAFVLLGGNAMAQSITGSKHDLTQYSSLTTNPPSYACEACHTPHPTVASPITNMPLSSRDYGPAVGTYTAYSSSTMDATVPEPVEIDLVCLSCHDGTTAVDAYDGSAGTTGATIDTLGAPASGTTAAVVGVDLSDDHPVSFDYSASSTADGEIQTESTNAQGNNEVTDGTTTVPLFGGAGGTTMQCASCHDVHDTTNVPFLRSTASALCVTCHIK